MYKFFMFMMFITISNFIAFSQTKKNATPKVEIVKDTIQPLKEKIVKPTFKFISKENVGFANIDGKYNTSFSIYGVITTDIQTKTQMKTIEFRASDLSGSGKNDITSINYDEINGLIDILGICEDILLNKSPLTESKEYYISGFGEFTLSFDKSKNEDKNPTVYVRIGKILVYVDKLEEIRKIKTSLIAIKEKLK